MTEKVVEKKKYPQGKHWCLTINNPVNGDIPEDKDQFEYLIVGRETGEDGTKHLQVYVIFKWRKNRKGVSAVFPRAHIEYKQGPMEKASDYCKKDGDYDVYGTLPKTAGQVSKERMKKRWEDAYASAKAGNLEEIPKNMLVPYYHAWKRIQQDNPLPVEDLEKPCGIWLHGKTGAGKSHKARHDYGEFYDKPLNKWWDGYRGQETVILDDLDNETAKYIGPRLKRWADKYSFPAEQKGTTVQLRPKRIIVTSQYPLCALFQGHLGDALNRRFEEIYIQKRMTFAEAVRKNKK